MITRKSQLLDELKLLADSDDTEHAHAEADDILIAYIDDPEIENAYNEIGKWYA